MKLHFEPNLDYRHSAIETVREATDGNAYIIACDRAWRWSKCPGLKPGDTFDAQFTILELVSPAADPTDVIRLEANWKDRLHTRAPHGLNEN